MKIIVLSDIHMKFENFDLSSYEGVDAILCAGDMTWMGRNRSKEVRLLRRWVREVAQIAPFYWIPGNHDMRFTDAEFQDIENTIPCKDRVVQLGDYTVYGVSLSPCYDKPRMIETCDFVTMNPLAEEAAYDFEPVDIVISHAPPHGILDLTKDARNIGSECLLKYINTHKPKYVFCGHVHEAAGHARHGSTDIYNIACKHMMLELK